MRTIGGIYGTVTNVKDDVITISVGPDRVQLVFARGAIANVEVWPLKIPWTTAPSRAEKTGF